MKEPEMKKIADFIDRAIKSIADENELKKIKEEVKEMCIKFPVPGIKI